LIPKNNGIRGVERYLTGWNVSNFSGFMINIPIRE